MGRLTKAILIVLIAIAIDRLCTLPFIPSNLYVDPFPFYDPIYRFDDGNVIRGINFQYLVKAVTERIGSVLYLCGFLIALPLVTKRLFSAMIVIQSLALADFFLLYEQSFFSLGNYPVEFTDFRILGHATCILLWKTGKL